MSDDLDLGIYRDSPVRDRLIRRTLFVLTYAIANPLTNLVLTVVIVWFASNYARALIEEWYWSALLFVAILIIITPVSIYALKHVLSVIDGEPVFGKLGGLPRGMYRTIALAASHMDVRIADEHRDKVRDFTQLDLRMMHDEFQARYEDLPEVAGSDKADFETIWKDQILKFKIEGAKTFGELFGGGNAVGMLASSAVIRSRMILHPLGALFLGTMIVCLYYHLKGSLSLHSILQIGVSLCIVIAAIWSFLLMYSFREIEIQVLDGAYRPEVFAKYEEEVEKFVRTTVKTHVEADPTFFEVLFWRGIRVRCYFTVVDILFIYFLLGLSLAGVYIFGPDIGPEILNWHYEFAIGATLAGLGLIAGIMVFTYILRYLKVIAAPAAVFVIVGALPFGVEYLIEGDVELETVRAALLTVGGGLSGAVATAISAKAKRNISS